MWSKQALIQLSRLHFVLALGVRVILLVFKKLLLPIPNCTRKHMDYLHKKQFFLLKIVLVPGSYNFDKPATS